MSINNNYIVRMKKGSEFSNERNEEIKSRL